MGVQHGPEYATLGVGTGAAPTFLLWGDSHAGHYASVLSEYSQSIGESGQIAELGNCPPFIGIMRMDKSPENCSAFRHRVLQYLQTNDQLEIVILAGAWGATAEADFTPGNLKGPFIDAYSEAINAEDSRQAFLVGLERTVARLVKMGKRVWIIGPAPGFEWNVATTMERSIAYNRPLPPPLELSTFLNRHKFVMTVLDELHSTQNVDVIYPHNVLCDELHCHYKDRFIPLYFDSNHLSREGSARVLPSLANIIGIENRAEASNSHLQNEVRP
jgi:hypothetical protein